MTDNHQLQHQAQVFMNRHRIAMCFEAGGKFFKRIENAQASGYPVTEHTANAGIRKKKINQLPCQ